MGDAHASRAHARRPCDGRPFRLRGGRATPPARRFAATYASGDCGADELPARPGGTGILADGDFSQAPIPSGSGDAQYYRGQEFAPAWLVGRRSITFVGPQFWNIDGLCSVDLDGISAGSIEAGGFLTTRGATYTVTFLLSGNGGYGAGNPPVLKTMKVQAAKQFAIFTWDTSNDNDVEHGIYAPQTWSFKAAGPTTMLKFVSKGHRTSSRGAVVAAISVTQNP